MIMMNIESIYNIQPHFIVYVLTDSVQKNWPSKEGKDLKRVRTAICACLKLAAQRQARCLAREQRVAQNRPELDF